MMTWVTTLFNKTPSFRHYNAHLNAISDSVSKNPGFCIEMCKSIIEGVCKTILTNKGIDIEKDSFGCIVSQTFKSINLEQYENKQQLDSLFKRITGITNYIGDLRNQAGFSAHGQDIDHPKYTEDLALLTVHTTNAILGILLHLYIKNRETGKEARLKYEDYEEFNEYFDELNEQYNEFGLSISKALFDQDPIAYKELLLEFKDSELNKKEINS